MTVGPTKPPPPPPSPDPAEQLHALENSLASLRLRLGVVAADPRWDRDPNILALVRIADTLMVEARGLRTSIGSRRTRPRRRVRGA